MRCVRPTPEREANAYSSWFSLARSRFSSEEYSMKKIKVLAERYHDTLASHI
jgi:hypothetical protein